MRGLAALTEAPPDVRGADGLLARLDAALSCGLTRQPARTGAALAALADVLPGTPLARRVRRARERLAHAALDADDLAAVAMGRAAVQGAQHDALRAQLARALGGVWEAGREAAPAAVAAVGARAATLEGARQGLTELALSGFEQATAGTLATLAAAAARLQGERGAERLAMLLMGYVGELAAARGEGAARGDGPRPTRRWADLWTRAVVLATAPPPPRVGARVSGRWTPLAVDLRHHPGTFSAVAHGVLEVEGAPARLTRATASAYKVDAITDAEMWQLIDPALDPWLVALGEQRACWLEGVTLLDGGDLVLDGGCEAQEAVDVFAQAAAWLGPESAARRGVGPALDRHPALLGELVALEDVVVEADGGAVRWAGGRLPLAVARLSHATPLREALTRASALLGLMCFDAGGWALHPLVAQVGRGRLVHAAQGAEEAPARRGAKGGTLATLRERASRLLRGRDGDGG